MDNAILLVTVLLFGWTVLYNYGYRRGFRQGQDYERDATTRRFIEFRIQRFGDRLNYSTRHENN